ncbi:hypothetical protein ACOSQ2_017152 [Xanthoceras sorbifolium]
MIPVNVLPPLATKFELQLRSLVIVECFLLENGWPWLLAGTCYYTTYAGSFAGGRGILKDLYGVGNS